MGEEAEKQMGGAGGVRLARRLFGVNVLGNINELSSFMVSCFQNQGASQVLGWRNWGWEQVRGAAATGAGPPMMGWQGESFCPGSEGPLSFSL